MLKQLLDYEIKVENDEIGFLTKDWQTFYEKGPFYEEEITVVNSYLNSLENTESQTFTPSKRSKKKHLQI